MGEYEYLNFDDKTHTTINMAGLMRDDVLMKASANPKDFKTAMVPIYERILFQQLAQYTWGHLEADEKQHTPFIAFDPKPCDQVQPNDKSSLGQKVIFFLRAAQIQTLHITVIAIIFSTDIHGLI